MKFINKKFFTILYLVVLPIGMALTFFIVNPQFSRSMLVPLSGFEKLKPSVYISSGTSELEKDSLQSLLQHSNSRIIDFWGSKESTPTIIYCHSEELYKKYGSVSGSPANIFGTPMGSYIIIGPSGLNINVVSHEASHAELSKRLGWMTMQLKIPAWFDEGLALMVDYRFSNPDPQFRYEDYKKEWYRKTGFGAIKIDLRDITSADEFFKGETDKIYLSYLSSGLEVSHWMKKVGKNGLLAFIEKVKEGEGFGAAYLHVQKRIIKPYRFDDEPYYFSSHSYRREPLNYDKSEIK